jgi:hypothetical protein
MRRMIEIDIDESGKAHPVIPGTALPTGRATLILNATDEEMHRYRAESAFDDWLRPEEDEAWAHLQPLK